jgi:hypothetical protein
LNNLDELKELYPWPNKKPEVPQNMDSGWFCGQNMKALRDGIRTKEPCIILEMGAWLGMSTRYICSQSKSDCIVITIDHWLGSVEHQLVPEWKELLPTLYDTFIANCWDFKNRLIPVRQSTEEGISLLASLKIIPQLIYLDAAHDAENVYKDLTSCIKEFPEALIIGDDWTWDSVREGVMNTLREHRNYDLITHETCYEVFKC